MLFLEHWTFLFGSLTICLLKMEDSLLRKLFVISHWVTLIIYICQCLEKGKSLWMTQIAYKYVDKYAWQCWNLLFPHTRKKIICQPKEGNEWHTLLYSHAKLTFLLFCKMTSLHALSRFWPPRHPQMVWKLLWKRDLPISWEAEWLKNWAHMGAVEPLDSLSSFPFLTR